MCKLDVGSEQSASVISEKLLGIFGELENLVRMVNEQSNNEQSQAFRQAIGSVCGSLILDVLGPLYKAYPQIQPASWSKGE